MAKNRFDTTKQAQERKQNRAAKKAAYFEKRRPARLAKLKEKRVLKLSNPNYQPGKNGPAFREPFAPAEFSIFLHEGGKRFHGLEIYDTADTKRDNKKGAMPFGVYLSPATVTFLTPVGKKWHMRIAEFGFIVNPKY